MPIPYRRSLLWNKIRILAIHFDFSKEDEEDYREIKHTVLLELIDLVNTVPYDILLLLRLVNCLVILLSFKNYYKELNLHYIDLILIQSISILSFL